MQRKCGGAPGEGPGAAGASPPPDAKSPEFDPLEICFGFSKKISDFFF